MRYTELFESSNEYYVVIINHGNGRQATWPNSEKPGLFTRSEADQIAKDKNSSQSPLSGGSFGSSHWHVKSLDDSLKYVQQGNPCYYALLDLKEKMYNMDDC